MIGTETFATAFNCMDGRVQYPVGAFIKERTGADVVDVITEPGMEKYIEDGVLVSRSPNLEVVERKLLISGYNHASLGIVVAGHEDCAGNRSDQSNKEGQIIFAAQIIQSKARDRGLSIPVFAAYTSRTPQGLWVANELTLSRRSTSYPTLGSAPRAPRG